MLFFSLVRCGIRKMDIAIIGQNCPRLKHLDLSESSVFDIFGPPEVFKTINLILSYGVGSISTPEG